MKVQYGYLHFQYRTVPYSRTVLMLTFKYPILKEQGRETLSGHCTNPNSPKNKLHKKFRTEWDF